MTESTSGASAATGEITEAAQRIAAAGPSARVPGRDPVNQPMINNWVEAIGDANPIYVDAAAARAAGHDGIVAPPAMAQVWTMRGLHGVRDAADPMQQMTELLDAAGYTSVVATNCEQTYHRYLHVGEEVSVSTELESVAGPKRTALGTGWFFTTKSIWYVGDEPVAEMLFRILKFAPPAAADGPPIRPVVSPDTEFFWAGTRAGELRIQRLPDGTLRHPPVPAIWHHHDEPVDYQVASGRGTVFSFVVHHAPKVPGRQLPFTVVLVELDEGVRMLGELRGVDEPQIGMAVVAGFDRVDGDLTVPYWMAAR